MFPYNITITEVLLFIVIVLLSFDLFRNYRENKFLSIRLNQSMGHSSELFEIYLRTSVIAARLLDRLDEISKEVKNVTSKS